MYGEGGQIEDNDIFHAKYDRHVVTAIRQSEFVVYLADIEDRYCANEGRNCN